MGLFHCHWIPDSFGSMGNLFPNIFAAPLLTSTRENVWEKQSLGESRPRKPSPFMNVIPICPTNKTSKTGQGNTRMVKCGKLMQRPPCHNLVWLIMIIWGQRLTITKLECQKVIVIVNCQKGHIGHLRYFKVVCRLENWYVSVDSLTHQQSDLLGNFIIADELLCDRLFVRSILFAGGEGTLSQIGSSSPAVFCIVLKWPNPGNYTAEKFIKKK